MREASIKKPTHKEKLLFGPAALIECSKRIERAWWNGMGSFLEARELRERMEHDA